MATPKVSIVIPCYNVAKFLRQCMDSVVNQTLQEIEIICVNDGSTDATLSILEEYAQRDSRVIIVDKPNGGYGESMNRGIDMASGAYIGIVESDDFAEPHMFETLYNCAVKHDLDVARGGYFRYVSSPKVRNTPVMPLTKIAGSGVFCPMTDLRKPVNQLMFFKDTPSIWAAIYRTAFIREQGIRFLESPGASYQDTGFNFKVWVSAKRVKLVDACFLHYRTDNAASSVHNPGKVYCLCDEYTEIQRYLERNPGIHSQVLPMLVRLKYESYRWNYERLAEQLQAEFIHRFAKEMRQHDTEGRITRRYFSWSDRNDLRKIMLDPDRYHMLWAAKARGESVPDFYEAYPDKRPVRGQKLYFLVENLMGGIQTARESGWGYTTQLFFKKVFRRLHRKQEEQVEV